MKTTGRDERRPDAGSVRAALSLALAAPSVHNSQPWQWRWDAEHASDAQGVHAIDLYADRSRWLRATDPRGTDLLVSCGVALHHARVAFAAEGWSVDAQYLPDRVAAEPPGPIDVSGHRRRAEARGAGRRDARPAVGPEMVCRAACSAGAADRIDPRRRAPGGPGHQAHQAGFPGRSDRSAAHVPIAELGPAIRRRADRGHPPVPAGRFRHSGRQPDRHRRPPEPDVPGRHAGRSRPCRRARAGRTPAPRCRRGRPAGRVDHRRGLQRDSAGGDCGRAWPAAC